jgi:hypothetical protein
MNKCAENISFLAQCGQDRRPPSDSAGANFDELAGASESRRGFGNLVAWTAPRWSPAQVGA